MSSRQIFCYSFCSLLVIGLLALFYSWRRGDTISVIKANVVVDVVDNPDLVCIAYSINDEQLLLVTNSDIKNSGYIVNFKTQKVFMTGPRRFKIKEDKPISLPVYLTKELPTNLMKSVFHVMDNGWIVEIKEKNGGNENDFGQHLALSNTKLIIQ